MNFIKKGVFCTLEHLLGIGTVTVLVIGLEKKPALCTKRPNLKMLFYYIKVPAHSSPYHSTLPLTGALKWGTVLTSISFGIETRMGQSWM